MNTGEESLVMFDVSSDEHTQRDDEKVRRSDQEPKPTDDDTEWKLVQHEHNLKSAITNWHKRARSMERLLADSSDLDVVKQKRDVLERYVDDVSKAHDLLDQLMPSRSMDPDNDLYDQSVEQDGYHLSKSIADHIRNMMAERDSRVSKGSRASSKSHASWSSKASTASAKAEAPAESAALKTKLKYFDSDAKRRAELSRVQEERQAE